MQIRCRFCIYVFILYKNDLILYLLIITTTSNGMTYKDYIDNLRICRYYAKLVYDRLVQDGKDFAEIYNIMKKKYSDKILTMVFPLDIISDNIDKIKLDGISDRLFLTEDPSLAEEFVKKHFAHKSYDGSTSIFDFDVLYKRNICSPDMELNILMVDGTHKVSVTSYFPLNALCDIFPTADKKQSYYSIGSEEPLDKDMKFSELESNTIFICLEDE